MLSWHLSVPILLTLYLSWRYSRSEIDPDWSYFNLAAFTGSRYGRDFPDCKTPAIHLWYYLIARAVGANVRRVRLAHHLLIGAGGLGIYLLSGDVAAGTALTLLVNSGWLFAFHGNVGQQPAVFIALALLAAHSAAPNPWIASLLWLLALAFEPKLLVAFSLAAIVYQLWPLLPLLLGIGLIALIAWQYRHKEWQWLVESSITIPLRIAAYRRENKQYPRLGHYTARGLIYILPWLAASVLSRPDLVYWLPALGYIAVLALDNAVRPNHLLPLAAWIAIAGLPWHGMPPSAAWHAAAYDAAVIALVVCDLLSSGLYLGDLWERFYPGLQTMNVHARAAGQWLAEKAGTVWVNALHSGVYIYARKPIPYGLAEQVEIREVAAERRKAWINAWRTHPPTWVVVGDAPGVNWNASGFTATARVGNFVIWRKDNDHME